ncbi:hypothetical protein CY34DRAFT_100246 [Suillus luteus UH-Slu-Lm8-n1]|uniref:HAT C-terminal dimerisation domain-containing protein n=1 Tax=Suillus luteus UH-Slu-Lm8-n1 TaxID=930992 RepID=A0A0C9Z6G1_9AGAM|nr:hypothetical protein CY34DRAFT_100246 [Suillus luteus UH-Slu-Lm8-n1]
MDVEHVTNPIAWWQERCKSFPCLSHMAIDYLTIPATSVDVERLFSRGRLILSHVRNRLSAQSMRALLCVGLWSELGLVDSKDIFHASKLLDVIGEEEALDEGWDSIQVE